MRTQFTAFILTVCFLFLTACNYSSERSLGQAEKTTLHIGVLQQSTKTVTNSVSALEQLVRSYNVASEQKGWNVEVVIDSYGMQGDRDAMLTLNSTLSSKTNAPDLLMVEGMPWQSYSDRGLLVDLYDRMEPEGGEGLSRDDFFQGPLHALEYDGNLFCLPAGFLTEITYGTEEYFTAPGPVDTDTLFETWHANSTDTVLMTGGYARLTVFRTLALSAVFARYVDPVSKTCSFADPAFARLLEQFKSLPANDVDTLTSGQAVGTDVMEGTAFVNISLMSSYWQYLTYITYFPDAVPVLLPGSDSASAYCQYTTPLAITTSSVHQDAAWDFIDYCLHNGDYNFPMRKARFDHQIRQNGFFDLWSVYEDGEKTDLAKLSLMLPNPSTGNMEQTAPYTREAHEAFCDLLDQPMCPRFGIGFSIMYQPTELENIILTEVEQYFNDKCTLEQCIAVIQERVELYLTEQG